jgi:hypothetical protein
VGTKSLPCRSVSSQNAIWRCRIAPEGEDHETAFVYLSPACAFFFGSVPNSSINDGYNETSISDHKMDGN